MSQPNKQDDRDEDGYYRIDGIQRERDDEDVAIGFGSWRPRCLQFMASPKYFMLNFSILAIIDGSIGAFLIGCSTTLEKRYGYSGKMTGILLISGTISMTIVSPLIGFVGKRVNQAASMGWGMILVAIGCWLNAMPYFLYGAVDYASINEPTNSLFTNQTSSSHSREFCGTGNPDDCSADGSSITVWPAYIIIFISHFIDGIGASIFYTLGFPYMDDNVDKKNSPLYFSILVALRLLGPTAGFLLVSICLNLNEDPMAASPFDIKDPRFIGAWWIGFMVIGTTMFIFSLPMLLFPATLRKKEEKEEPKQVAKIEVTMSKSNASEFKSSLKRLMTNPVWMFDTAAGVIRSIGLGGYYVTQPKYIESQFRKSAASASLLTGATGIVAMAIGSMTGGLFMRFARPGPRLLTSLTFMVELFACAGIISGLFFGCTQSQFVGIDHNDGYHFNPSQTCNSECGCSQRVLQPVCGSDQVSNYFSPCFAGCTSFDNGTYSGCHCDPKGYTTKGYCPADTECDTFHTYIALLSIGNLISFTSRTGNFIVRMRSIDESDKAFSTGIMSALYGLFSYIPHPIMFGAIADSACLIWEKSCGGTGNCWLYDNEKFRYYLHSAAIVFLLMGSALDIFVIFYSKRMKNLYGEDDEPKKEINSNINEPIDASTAL